MITSFERFPLVHSHTALEPMPNLTRALGGPTLYIKRDDTTGLALGGNKTRKLEFLLADARKRGANHLITHGAVQSNHVRQTAAAAVKAGMRFTGLLEHRIEQPTPDYLESGNVLLDRLLDARLVYTPGGTNMDRAMQEHAAVLEAQGERPYIVSGGGSSPLGTLGYVACADELMQQATAQRLRIDFIVHPTGSGGTQAGLVAGLTQARSRIRVLGVSVKAARAYQETHVRRLAQQTLELLGSDAAVGEDAVEVTDEHVGAGYGQPTAAMVESVEKVARLEGILLDPVYTGKAMAGLIAWIRAGRLTRGHNVVFLHTGGAPSLFSYRQLFAAANEAPERRNVA